MDIFQTVGAVIALFVATLTVFREFSLIKRFALFFYSKIKKGWVMLSRWLYWFRYSPKIKITKKPIDVITETIDGTTAISYRTSIELALKPKEKEVNTIIDIREIEVVISQGYGIKKREIELSRDTEKSKQTALVLSPKDSVSYEEIFFEGTGNILYPKRNIKLNKQFRWKIDNIQVEAWELRKGKKFRGHIIYNALKHG